MPRVLAARAHPRTPSTPAPEQNEGGTLPSLALAGGLIKVGQLGRNKAGHAWQFSAP